MEIIVIAHNIRSTHNVGAFFRTCDGFGVTKLYLTGYTPYPILPNDLRMPHIAQKLTKQIHKTAIGAELTVPFAHHEAIEPLLDSLRASGYTIAALEQTPTSIPLQTFKPPAKIALLLGEEVAGIAPELLGQCDVALEIPMHGKKESFNVSVAQGIALYALRHNSPL